MLVMIHLDRLKGRETPAVLNLLPVIKADRFQKSNLRAETIARSISGAPGYDNA
jgi:hypothetical protein